MAAKSKRQTGFFSGPISGLRYQTPTCTGVTGPNGEFQFEDGERIAFLVGGLILGTAIARPRLDLSLLVSRVDGVMHKVQDPILTNMARLVQTLDEDGDASNGVQISAKVHDVVGTRPIKFAPDMGPTIVEFADPVGMFTDDPVVRTLMQDLNSAGVFSADAPRRLRSAAAARNELRRNMLGIRRYRDVKIPLRNGSYIYADVFRPDKPGKFPVIMNFGIYGRAFVHHSIGDELDAEKHEQMEERYFLGNSDGYMYENHESVNTAVWVPQDYIAVRVDGPGTGKNPGTIGLFGIEEAEAYYDAIEWAGVQDWSNGNVGLFGMSYYAINQHAVASLQPPHLKAMVAVGTDTNLYEEMVYQGGIFNNQFWPLWWNSQVVPAVCGEVRALDYMAAIKAHPFNEPDSDFIYGPRAKLFMSPDMSKVTVPVWVVGATTHAGHIHQIGSSEAFIDTPIKDKKFDLVEDWFQKAYSSTMVADHMAFFDYWLKGIDNGIMDKPPVRLEIRTGSGSLYVQEENEWPVARTRYTRWYLDATPSDWKGDGRRQDFMRLSQKPPSKDRKAEYSAQVELYSAHPRKPWAAGISFISEPVGEDMVLAGYMKAGLCVASSSRDMDIYVSVRIMEETGEEIDYVGPMYIAKDPKGINPLGKGWLKASHRKLDPARSTEYRPKHTHLAADYAPLKQGDMVEVEVEIPPNTALVRKGQRIRVDVQPYDGSGHGLGHHYEASYHDGAVNSVFTGPKRASYIQLPILPPK